MKYLTIKDEEGVIRPMACLWAVDKIKWHIDDIENYLRKNKECKLVELELKEIGEVDIKNY